MQKTRDTRTGQSTRQIATVVLIGSGTSWQWSLHHQRLVANTEAVAVVVSSAPVDETEMNWKMWTPKSPLLPITLPDISEWRMVALAKEVGGTGIGTNMSIGAMRMNVSENLGAILNVERQKISGVHHTVPRDLLHHLSRKLDTVSFMPITCVS
ncbi:unnamed protein product, partial [Dibothriocephalus latus]